MDCCYDAHTEPWYETAIELGESTWSDIYEIQGSSDTLGVTLSSPIETDDISGVVFATFTLTKLQETLQGFSLDSYDEYALFVVDSNGLLVGSTHGMYVTLHD